MASADTPRWIAAQEGHLEIGSEAVNDRLQWLCQPASFLWAPRPADILEPKCTGTAVFGMFWTALIVQYSDAASIKSTPP